MRERTVPIKTPFFYGWVIAWVAALVGLTEVAFFQPVLGVFMKPLHEEFGWSRGTIAGAIGLGSLLGGLVSPLIGVVLDKWGGRWVMAAGCLVMSVCLFLLAGVKSIVAFYLLYMIGRASTASIINLAASVTVSNWFIRNRGPAIGVLQIGTRAGQALLPAMVAVLITVVGWRSGFVALGVIVLVLGVLPSLIFVRRRPEDIGLHPDGLTAVSPSIVTQPPLEVDWPRSEALRTRAFWLLTAATSMSMMAGGALNLHMIPYVQDKGLPTAVAVSVLSLLAIVSGAGSFLGGFVERRLGGRWTFALSLSGQALAMVILLNVRDLWTAYGFAVYYGLVFGTTVTMHSMIFATYFGRLALGSIRGIASPIQLAANALGPFAGGLIHDVTGSYVLAFGGFGVLYTVAALCVLLAAQPSLKMKRAPQFMA